MSAFLKSPFVPTEAQQDLLFSLKKERQHTFFRAETGSGKSFILAMHALNLPRSLNRGIRPTTTALIIVPNPDLAVQYFYWIKAILSTSITDPAKLARIVQAIFRTNTDDEQKQEQKLTEFPCPHVIITTPTRMLDLIAKDQSLFDFENLKTIIVDEADEIIQPPEKVVIKKIRHPTPGEQLLDWIFEKRKAVSATEFMKFVATSATLTTSFNSFLSEKEWLGDTPVDSFKVISPSSAHSTSPQTEQHVLLVSLRKSSMPEQQPDRIRIAAARLPHATMHHNVRTKPPREKDEEAEAKTHYPPNYLAIPAMQRVLRETSTTKAMVLIPHGASKADFVWACHYFGLTGAQELRFSLSEAENGFLEPQSVKGGGPTVFVAYPKDIRGLDLKRINIVFVMGEFGTVEDYVHITGRTGRHRPGGSVITILEESTGNLSQKLLNIAIKLVRSGSRPSLWALPPIEVDLKPLPGDKYEQIRSEAGIITRTEEVALKEEREKKSKEERKKWLQMEGIVEPEPEEVDAEEELDSQLERPTSFGMEAPSISTSISQEPRPLDIGELDWRDALAQSLKRSASKTLTEGTDPKPVERVLVDLPVSNEDLDEELEDDTILTTADSDKSTETKSLEAFGGSPEFPKEQYQAAVKIVREYYRNRTNSSNSVPPVNVEETQASESTIPPEALLPNQAVLRRQDEPILPHTDNLTTKSSPEDIKLAMEGESLRQLGESQITSPGKTRRKSKKSSDEQQVKVTKARRGRPKKNTTDVA